MPLAATLPRTIDVAVIGGGLLEQLDGMEALL